MPTDLFAARMLWEDEPTPAGSRTLVGKAKARDKGVISVDPLKWLTSGQPSVWTGN